MSDRPIVTVGDIAFDLYGSRTQPDIEISGGVRTVEKELIGAQPATQVLGPKRRQITISGECSRETAGAVDELNQSLAPVVVRSDRFGGSALPVRSTTSPLNKRHEGTDVYQFRIELVEVEEFSELAEDVLEQVGLL